MTISVTSPVQNQQVCAPVTLIASAVTTSVGAHITRWQVDDQNGHALWATAGPVSSIKPEISLPAGTETVQVEAFDSAGQVGGKTVAFDVTTATPPCGGNGNGPVATWRGCMETVNGSQRQAVMVNVDKPATLPFNATLYFGSNCEPSNWADQFGFNQLLNFGGFGFTFWFRDFPNQPNTSAIWTVGNQSSGCINYSTAPPC